MGVEVIFGLPADGINGFMDALRARGAGAELEQVADLLDESSFEASPAHAPGPVGKAARKLTGRDKG